MLQLNEQIKVLVYTNVTSVLYTFVNNRQNNVTIGRLYNSMFY